MPVPLPPLREAFLRSDIPMAVSSLQRLLGQFLDFPLGQVFALPKLDVGWPDRD
jgi:hypothetical protein